MSSFGEVTNLAAPLSQRYAVRWGISEGRFEFHLLPRVLHSSARLIFNVVSGLNPNHFDCDKELLRDLAVARDLKQVESAIRDFRSDPRNRKFLRRHLKIRISVAKVTRELRPLLIQEQ